MHVVRPHAPFRSLRPIVFLLLVTTFCLVGGDPTAAATLVVDQLTDGSSSGSCSSIPTGSCELRRALADANSGDRIEFDPNLFNVPATVTLGSELLLNKPLVLEGPGRDLLTLRGSGSDRVLRVNTGGTALVSALTIANGFAGTAAATQFGGGVMVESGSVIFSDMTFAGGVVDHANGGGANVAVSNGTARIQDSRIVGGLARGGSVGGGAYVGGGTLILFNCVLDGNESFSEGAAIAAAGGLTYLTQSTVTQNTAVGEGGALFVNGGNVVVEFSTLAFNDSVGSQFNAREIYVGAAGGTAFLSHTVLEAPSIISRGIQPITICADDSGNASPRISSIGYNLANRPCFLTDTNDLAMQPVGLGALTTDGRTTYYPLQADSPAVDAGQANCTSAVDLLAFDQRGLPRNVDGDQNAQAACDLGAIEYQTLIFEDGFESGDVLTWQ